MSALPSRRPVGHRPAPVLKELAEAQQAHIGETGVNDLQAVQNEVHDIEARLAEIWRRMNSYLRELGIYV